MARIPSSSSKKALETTPTKVVGNTKKPTRKVQDSPVKPGVKISRKTTATVRRGIKADVFDLSGKIRSSIELPSDLFDVKVNKQVMLQAVRVYLANQRQGTQSTKTRSEVTGSTRKIYRQKGTGRARHGGITAPIFVGGGVALGPKPRDYGLSLPKKMRRAALASALTTQLSLSRVKIIDGLEGIEPKTKIFVKALQNLNLDEKKKKILVVLPTKAESVARAIRNVEGVSFVRANQLNTYEVLNTKMLLIVKTSVEVLESTFGKESK